MTWLHRDREPTLALVVLTVIAVAGAALTGGGARPGIPTGGAGGLIFLGFPDCERPRLGRLAQPANAISALAFVVVGLGVLAGRGSRRLRVPYGAVAVLIGIGSFAFHRAMTEWSAWLDTFAIAALALLVAAHNLDRVDRRLAPPLAAVAAAIWLAPNGADNALLVALIAVAAFTEVMRWRSGSRRDRRLLALAASLYAAGLVVFALSRTGGPWCDPGSALQGHAVWHVIAAGVVAVLYAYLRSDQPGS